MFFKWINIATQGYVYLWPPRVTIIIFLCVCLPVAQETGVQYQVESYQRLRKWYLIAPCLTLSILRLGSRVKWSNPWKEVAPSTTPWCSSYWKGSLRWQLYYFFNNSLWIHQLFLTAYQLLRVISCIEVRESHSLYSHIYLFFVYFLKKFFFCSLFYWIQIIFKQIYLTHR